MSSTNNRNRVYKGKYLSHVAFPMGGIGAGMICLDGNGGLSHVSIENQPDVFNEPCTFSAVCIKGETNTARVLEGPVPMRKVFGLPNAGNGRPGTKPLGLPRFGDAQFEVRFPFAMVTLTDSKLKLAVTITGWSPFIPGDADRSSLPVSALEYRFLNTGKKRQELVFSFNSVNFVGWNKSKGIQRLYEDSAISPIENGFIFQRQEPDKQSKIEASLSVQIPAERVGVNCAWYRGGWFDALSMAWKDVQEGACFDRPPAEPGLPSSGASIFARFILDPGETKTLKLLMAWYVPESSLRLGTDTGECSGECDCQTDTVNYRPWHAGRFDDVEAVSRYWRDEYDNLKQATQGFSDCFYDTDLPPEIIDAVAANLTILKSPTVLRQTDGRLWAWEGCSDKEGCCAGSCTHVWNYAQAIPHLFPELEQSLRQTEFYDSQDENGHQTFRAGLPIRPIVHQLHAAADGQLGGVMKVYREWRISGDKEWLQSYWPKVKQSLDYCIGTWDPDHKGALFEPHHNTYDIEFWGPDGMCTSFYLGALKAAILIGEVLEDPVPLYEELFSKGKQYLEEQLFDGEYFIQKVMEEELRAGKVTELIKRVPEAKVALEDIQLMEAEGPKYQYGKGCLSDGVLGDWMAAVCGVGEIINRKKLKSHLKSVYKYNFRKHLKNHANPQRPTYAVGEDGGLLLCSWPKGGELSLPFVYSNEVWTGIEYQAASHMMMQGMVKQGLKIVKTARKRYDGQHRNPFNEYECGHWYARAMASYGLLQGITGIRYDAVEKALYIRPAIKGDFRSFLITASGYGTVGVRKGKPFVEVKSGNIQVDHIHYQPKK